MATEIASSAGAGVLAGGREATIETGSALGGGAAGGGDVTGATAPAQPTATAVRHTATVGENDLVNFSTELPVGSIGTRGRRR